MGNKLNPEEVRNIMAQLDDEENEIQQERQGLFEGGYDEYPTQEPDEDVNSHHPPFPQDHI